MVFSEKWPVVNHATRGAQRLTDKAADAEDKASSVFVSQCGSSWFLIGAYSETKCPEAQQSDSGSMDLVDSTTDCGSPVTGTCGDPI